MQPARITAATLALAAGLAVAPRTAFAQADSTLNWANAAGGPVSTSTNWSPNQVPAAADDLTFNLAGSYSITFNATVPTSHAQTYKRGTVIITASSPHTATAGVTVGDALSDNATMTLTSGTFNANSASIIANAAGSVGAINVNASGADFVSTGNLFVGNGGAGTLNIAGLGHVGIGGSLFLGSLSSGGGTLVVSGSQVVAPFATSALDVNGPGESRLGQLGDSNLIISSGARATFASRLIVAHGSASTSTISVHTAGFFPARLICQSDLSIGRNTIAGSAAGNGSCTIGDGGSATVSSTLFIGGDPDGGVGTLHLTDNTAAVTTQSLAIGAGGTLDIAAGQLTVDGGTLSYSNSTAAFVLTGSVDSKLLMDHSATATLNPTVGFTTPALTVGGGSGANTILLKLDHGAQITIASGDMVIADGSDDGGNLTLVNTGSLTFSQPGAAFKVGNGGDGFANVGSGTTAHITAPHTFIACLPGSSGTILIDGNAATVQAQEMIVGGVTAADGGDGVLQVFGGSTLDVLGTGSSLHVWPTGTLQVTGSTVNVADTALIEGPFTLTNASITAISVDMKADGSVSGTLAAKCNFGNDSGDAITLNGDLTAGNAASSNGFVNFSSLDVGAHALTILDANLAVLNNCTVASGGSVTAAHGVNIATNATLSGSGIINAAISNSGHLTSTGSGLTLKGLVTGIGQGITGATTNWLQGGGFTGAGTIATQINADAQAVFTATGNLTMGNAANNFGFICDGTIHCANHIVTLLDANGIGLGTMTDIAGGTLVCSQNLTVNAGRSFLGRGFVQAPALNIPSGTISPGDTQAGGVDLGTLNLGGSFTLGATSTFNCTLGPGVEFDDSDRVFATGAATIAGTLNVGLMPGFTPSGADQFDIIVGSTRTGQFTQTNFPTIPSGPMRVVYLPDRVRLILCYANCDSSTSSPVLNVADFTCFLQKYALGDPYANCDSSTQAPTLNVADFTCFLQKYANGCS